MLKEMSSNRISNTVCRMYLCPVDVNELLCSRQDYIKPLYKCIKVTALNQSVQNKMSLKIKEKDSRRGPLLFGLGGGGGGNAKFSQWWTDGASSETLTVESFGWNWRWWWWRNMWLVLSLLVLIFGSEEFSLSRLFFIPGKVLELLGLSLSMTMKFSLCWMIFTLVFSGDRSLQKKPTMRKICYYAICFQINEKGKNERTKIFKLNSKKNMLSN